MEKRTLGVLLSTPPSHPHAGTVIRLCQAALKAHIDVYLYLIDEGVKNLHDPRLLELPQAGVKVFACAYGCQRHRVSTDTVAPGVTLCGLVVLATMITACDRFLAFN
jgi:sulfur relay (sulfurtransferase) complex TusBCD TusD component (DsrE family)